jgi:hypothetical protein
MAKLFTALLILTCSVNQLGAQDCKCITANPREITRQGYFAELSIIEKKPHKQIRGVVHHPQDDPLAGVLAEVFTYPQRLLKSKRTEFGLKSQRRVAACWTGASGEFCFIGIPKGAYELRLSKDGGWSTTHVYIAVNPNNRHSTKAKIIVPMQPGG